MKTIVEKINAGFEAFASDAAAQVESGNKAAGAALAKFLSSLRNSSRSSAKTLSQPPSKTIRRCLYCLILAKIQKRQKSQKEHKF